MGNVKYFPTLPEVLVSVGIFSAGILAFGLIAKYFPVFESEHSEEDTKQPLPKLTPVTHPGDD
jgi:Ni/Fe-hydrogenase subunit HybB-like protein